MSVFFNKPKPTCLFPFILNIEKGMSVAKLGEDIWRQSEGKISGELFALTYGALVGQLWDEMGGDAKSVNEELDRMGYNIGVRLIEEFLGRTQMSRCRDLKETAEAISKVGFKMFLNITPTITGWSRDQKEFQLKFNDNPLADFVELPPKGGDLWYSNILVGVLRGALEMVQLKCEIEWVSDILRGDAATVMRVKLLRVAREDLPAGDE